MNEQDARNERHDFVLQNRSSDYSPLWDRPVPWDAQPEPDFVTRFLRASAKWTMIACASWAVISGGMYLGYVVVQTIVFGPDIW